MAMFAPIPLPNIDNFKFDDVFDYLETMRKRQALQQEAAQRLSQEKNQFDVKTNLEKQRIAQEGALNPLKMELLKARIEEARKNAAKPELSKLDEKRLADIESKAGDLRAKMANSADASAILEKNKNVTGNLPALQTWAGIGSGDAGALNDIFGSMQADLAKDYSGRGSVYGTKLAGNRKPNMRYGYNQNIGILNEIDKDYYRRYKQMQADYKRISGGEDLPIDIPEHYKKVKVVSPKGDIYIKNPDEANDLLGKYPGSKILGSVYE